MQKFRFFAAPIMQNFAENEAGIFAEMRIELDIRCSFHTTKKLLFFQNLIHDSIKKRY